MDQQQQNLTFTQNLDTLFNNLEDFTKKEGVLGKPVTYGDKTLIPVISVTMGYGSGNSAAKNQQGTNTNQAGTNLGNGINAGMGALGLGAKISTDAIVVINKDDVSLLPVDQKANMGQIMDKIPQMLMNMGQNKQGQQQDQQSQQGQ